MQTNVLSITRKLLLAGLVALAASCCPKSSFVTVRDGQFYRNGKPYTYIGTNFWYGPILASEGQGGNLERLQQELDTLKALGMENLRVLVGGGNAFAGGDGSWSEERAGVYGQEGHDRLCVYP